MLKSIFATTAKGEPRTVNRGLKFAVDFKNFEFLMSLLNVSLR